MGWWGYKWNTVGHELIHYWSSVMATWVFHYIYTLYFYMYLEVSPNNQFLRIKNNNKDKSTFSVYLSFFLWSMASFVQVSSLLQISVELEGWLASLQPILLLCWIDGTSLSVLLPSRRGLVCPLVALSPASHMPTEWWAQLSSCLKCSQPFRGEEEARCVSYWDIHLQS